MVAELGAASPHTTQSQIVSYSSFVTLKIKKTESVTFIYPSAVAQVELLFLGFFFFFFFFFNLIWGVF